MSEFDIGRALPGWEADGVLGAGTFGTVYLAHTMVENKPVYGAVKVIKTPPTPQAVENAMKIGISRDLLKTYFNKFKNDLNWELTMYRTINSDNLVPVDEVQMEDLPEAGWIGYIKTPVYTPYEVYFDKVESTEEDAARLGAELCSAIAACSEYGMVHGEVKPENVMVADNGTFLLSDFGVKRCLEKAGAGLYGIIADPFEAPELSEDSKRTQVSDIYSVGALMSYTANNRRLSKDAEGYGEGLSPKFAAIINKATAQDPAERYQTAAEMRADIVKLELFTNRRPQRRAVAAAAAFDMVKRNGSTIRGEAAKEQPKQPEPEKKTAAANEKPQKTEKKKSKKGIILWTSLAVIALALVIGIRVWKPFSDRDTDVKSPVTDTDLKENETAGNEDKNTGDVIDPEDNTDAENNGAGTGDDGKNANQGENRNEGSDDNPDDNQPDDNQPDDNQPDDNQPDDNQPDDNQPDDNQPDDNQPDDNQPDDNQPDDNQPDDNQPDDETPDPYLLPTDTVLITADDLAGMTENDVAMAINEIYARHGKIFKTASIQEYFEAQNWYVPVSKDSNTVTALFTSIEKANLKTLTQYQKDKGWR